MVQAAPNTEALDEHLNHLVQTLHSAVGQAMRHLADDPPSVDRAIRDCQEIMDFVLEGDVQAWLGSEGEAEE